ncbi:polysaccharide lyase family 9 protein [Schizophyllum commune]
MVSLTTLLGRVPVQKDKRSRKTKRATEIFVSPDGSDSNAGTIDAPLASIQAAVDQASAGDTIYLREGTYMPTENIQIKKSGTSSAPYTISNYEGESVLIDGEELPYTPGELDSSIPSSDRGVFHVEADYWVFSGLEIVHGPYAIYADNSNNNIYRNLVTRDNYETGLQIQGESSNNLVENLDSYGNHDPRKNGESADGLGVKEGSGDGNIIRGTRLWNNVDDGLDFWEFKSPVTIENTYSWGNGFNRWNFEDIEGDGNGFKLGGGDASDKGPAAHVITNCIAFSNAAGGFVDNSQPGDMTLTRNTAWNNTRAGLQFDEPGYTVKSSSNSWDSGSWSDDSFVSLDSSTLTGARLANGSVAASSFLLPANGAAIGAYYV